MTWRAILKESRQQLQQKRKSMMYVCVVSVYASLCMPYFQAPWPLFIIRAIVCVCLSVQVYARTSFFRETKAFKLTVHKSYALPHTHVHIYMYIHLYTYCARQYFGLCLSVQAYARTHAQAYCTTTDSADSTVKAYKHYTPCTTVRHTQLIAVAMCSLLDKLFKFRACSHGSVRVHFLLPFSFTEETFALVSWPEEDNDVSVISTVRNRISGPIMVGGMCDVLSGKRTFPAMVHATGMYTFE